MTNRIFLIICLLLNWNALAQDCTCLQDFDKMVDDVRLNYAGYDDKITPRNKIKFNNLTQRLRDKATKAKGDDCELVLKEWVQFFRDGHLRVVTPASLQTSSETDKSTPSILIFNDKFIVLKIPTFNQYKAELDRLLTDNKEKISSTPNLIIDLRGNDGGSDWTYNNLIPLLYTNPIITPAAGIRSSDDNIKYYERFINKDNPSATPQWVTEIIDLMRKNKRQIVSNNKADRIVFDFVPPFPKTISILIDETNASSAETFLLKAKQSKKVKLFGSNTRGIVDYLNPNFNDLPCKKNILAVPTVKRSLQLPSNAIDNIGIQPDVRIDKNVKDKIQFIVNYHTRKSKT